MSRGGDLDPARLRRELTERGLPIHTIDVVATTGSTNADLLVRAAAGDPVAGAVLITEHQTAGRGRNGRTWSTIPGGQLSMSVGLAADAIPLAAWGWIPLITGLSVVDAAAEADVGVGLKWPNDVLAQPPSRGKLGGILAEVVPSSTTVVVGIGINVAMDVDELPDPDATSMTILGAAGVDRAALVVSILEGLTRRARALADAGGADDDLVADYLDRSLTVGRRVRAELPGGREIVGEAVSVDSSGRLIIDVGAERVSVSAGDIVHLRPV